MTLECAWRRVTDEAARLSPIHLRQLFADNANRFDDLSVTLVDKFPVSRLKHNWLYLTTMRKRGEARWIRRLEAQLNTRRQVWNLFSGCEAARGDPNPTETDDLRASQN